MKFTEAAGLRVMSRGTAEQVGSVMHLVVDPATHRITAIHVEGDKKKGQLIDWETLSGFGPDAVIVSSENALRETRDERERGTLAGDLDVLGKLVLSDRGNSCGVAQDVEFDPSTGTVESVLTSMGAIEATRLRSIGSYAVIVQAEEGPDPSGL